MQRKRDYTSCAGLTKLTSVLLRKFLLFNEKLRERTLITLPPDADPSSVIRVQNLVAAAGRAVIQ